MALDELVEQISRVVRTRGRLRVVLDTEGLEGRVTDSLGGVVVEIFVHRLPAPAERDSGRTTNPWFWEVISTRPFRQFFVG